jgi:hypothetical protein
MGDSRVSFLNHPNKRHGRAENVDGASFCQLRAQRRIYNSRGFSRWQACFQCLLRVGLSRLRADHRYAYSGGGDCCGRAWDLNKGSETEPLVASNAEGDIWAVASSVSVIGA